MRDGRARALAPHGSQARRPHKIRHRESVGIHTDRKPPLVNQIGELTLMVVDMFLATGTPRKDDWHFPRFEAGEDRSDTCVRNHNISFRDLASKFVGWHPLPKTLTGDIVLGHPGLPHDVRAWQKLEHPSDRPAERPAFRAEGDDHFLHAVNSGR